MLATGIIASDFELYATPDQRVRLSELKDRRIILAFYPVVSACSFGKDKIKQSGISFEESF